MITAMMDTAALNTRPTVLRCGCCGVRGGRGGMGEDEVGYVMIDTVLRLQVLPTKQNLRFLFAFYKYK